MNAERYFPHNGDLIRWAMGRNESSQVESASPMMDSRGYPTAVRCMVLVAMLVTAPGVAFAYIDRGNGAYMVQALFTLIGAALFYLPHPLKLESSAAG
jgi:hypothetical protein